ncbi:meiosis inhibitor protein 1-like [Lingula anatina]|uniref:Meiosis inhibitor protein 1-like n=1 Tax=Lingula anatina TaxID=7574 RepID=A0A1S3HXD2_LINAN|nr:meiosis inhibitor protein 1-like [Lingula anatina]|eukprot:XP_013390692.1 meiosis inhibitor protein 1-like [Lingula anatina]
MVFLMAVCTGSTQTHTKKEQQQGLRLLSVGLSKCSSTSSWLLGHPKVFQWCFLNPKISNMQGKHVLKQWLSIIPAQMSLSPLDMSQEPGWAELFTLVKENTKCLQAALDILTDGDEESVSKVTLLLGRVFEKDGKQSPNPKTVSKLKQMLSDVVHRIFLAKSVKKAKHNLTAMLEILLIMQDQFVTGINATDLKLVNQVCSLLGNENEKIPKQLVFMFEEFLSNLLLQAGKSQDNRVATIILTDKSFLYILQHLVLSNEDIVSTKALQLLALLVLQQADFSIPHLAKNQVQLQLEWLLERTKSKVYLQQISVLQFWAVYFSTQFTSSCAIVEILDDTDHTDLVGRDDTQLNVKTQYLRKLLIYIQQAVFKENRHLQCIAVICLHNLLTRYLKPQVLKTGHSLVEQPWNRFMLTTLLETFEARKTPTCVLAIVNLLVSRVGGELVKVKQLENIVTAFLKGDLKQDSWWNDVVVFLHYVCHNHILNSNLEKKVINKLEENHQYTDQCRQSDDTKKISKMYAIFDRSINA